MAADLPVEGTVHRDGKRQSLVTVTRGPGHLPGVTWSLALASRCTANLGTSPARHVAMSCGHRESLRSWGARRREAGDRPRQRSPVVLATVSQR